MSHNAPQAAQRNFEPLTQFDSMQLQGKPTGAPISANQTAGSTTSTALPLWSTAGIAVITFAVVLFFVVAMAAIWMCRKKYLPTLLARRNALSAFERFILNICMVSPNASQYSSIGADETEFFDDGVDTSTDDVLDAFDADLRQSDDAVWNDLSLGKGTNASHAFVKSSGSPQSARNSTGTHLFTAKPARALQISLGPYSSNSPLPSPSRPAPLLPPPPVDLSSKVDRARLAAQAAPLSARSLSAAAPGDGL